MKTKTRPFITEAQQAVLAGVQIRPLAPDERPHFDQLMCEQHYLKAAPVVGEQLRYVAEYQGQWVALWVWSAGAFNLKLREAWIGWTPKQKKRRLPLVANNSRFLILAGFQIPNLASRAMKLCLARLADDWAQTYGHPVLIAETFVDSQLFLGTCYKASGWTPLGHTQGCQRAREDFYVRHDRPKQLWVRELCAGACKLLRAESLPPGWQAAEAAVVPRCSYGVKQLQRMMEYFRGLKDLRGVIKRYPLAALLAVVLCATLCGVVRGQRDLAAFGRGLTKAQRRALRFRRNRRTGEYPAPCETTYFRLLKSIDPHALETALLGCQEHVLRAPTEADDLIAYDGKALRSARGIELASGFSVHTGRWMGTEAVAAGSNEIPAVQRLLARTDLSGKTAVLDALHTQVETARQLVQDCGADYVLTVKGNQKGLGNTLQQLWNARKGAFSPWGSDDGVGSADRTQ